MKKTIISFLAAVIISAMAMAQAPQAISYQAAVRNASGALITNKSVAFKISIMNGTTVANATAVFAERQTGTTDENGIFTCNIGKGGALTGTFATINWGLTGNFYIKVELDETGGSTYAEMGTSQLVSVPFAINALTAKTATSVPWDNVISKPANIVNSNLAPTAGDVLFYDGSNWLNLHKGTDGQILTLQSGVPVWKGGTTHYIGEQFGGGTVFYVDNTGEHGLIVSNTDVSINKSLLAFAAGASVLKNSCLDGKINTDTLKTVPSGGNGITDVKNFTSTNPEWYIPSYIEMQMIMNVIYQINSTINMLNINTIRYTTSTGDNLTYGFIYFNCRTGYEINNGTLVSSIRLIRKF